MSHNPQILFDLAQEQRNRLLAQAEQHRLRQLATAATATCGPRHRWLRWPILRQQACQQPTSPTPLLPSVN